MKSATYTVSVVGKRAYSLKVIDAARRTLNAYERLIDNPKIEIAKWARYGSSASCRFCRAVGQDEIGLINCTACPLSDPYADDAYNANGSAPCIKGIMGSTYDEMRRVIRNSGWELRRPNNAPWSIDMRTFVATAARYRLTLLRKRLRENGLISVPKVGAKTGRKLDEQKKAE